jgi:hypothetical protein
MKVYNVSRFTASKSTNVGDFETIDQAEAAMIEHYKATPKRGKFRYTINEEDLEEKNGMVTRSFVLFQNYNKRYNAEQLAEMI